MAMGRPVVATNVGGVTELVRDGVNGVVVAPGDPVALEAALADLVADPGLRDRLGAMGRTTVRSDFDSLTEARRLVTLFRDPGSPSPDSVRPVPAEIA
jgi:glycosyltransferase involved in cell wall biosynthesis